MQDIYSKITFGGFLLVPVTNAEVVETDISFLSLEAWGIKINSGFFDCNSSKLPGPGLVNFFF